jgi:hypothetical protein
MRAARGHGRCHRACRRARPGYLRSYGYVGAVCGSDARHVVIDPKRVALGQRGRPRCERDLADFFSHLHGTAYCVVCKYKKNRHSTV